MLRSYKQYYADAVAGVRHQIDEGWDTHGHLYANRAEYERSSYVEALYRTASPYWWGLNDVVGFIDIRANLPAKAIQAALFLTSKRPSRRLVAKKYVARKQIDVGLSQSSTNDSVRADLIDAVRQLCDEPAVRRFYVDLGTWNRMVEATDIGKFLRDELSGLLGTANKAGSDRSSDGARRGKR